MPDYRIRVATLDDLDVLVHHRIAMFQDMGVPLDAAAVDAAFRPWLLEMMPKGVYRAWVVESGAQVISGGGITILPWPPGPRYFSGRLAFVYNVYTEPELRRRKLHNIGNRSYRFAAAMRLFHVLECTPDLAAWPPSRESNDRQKAVN